MQRRRLSMRIILCQSDESLQAQQSIPIAVYPFDFVIFLHDVYHIVHNIYRLTFDHSTKEALH